MQKIRLLTSLVLVLTLCPLGKAQYNSVNYDYETARVMGIEYNAAASAEMYYDEQVKDILAKYGIAEVAADGIYASKHLDRKALTDLGILVDPAENHYYRRIYRLVSVKIIPGIWDLSTLLLRYPHKAIYWGSYLVKVCTEVKSLCQQFESVVTNGRLSFSDINFLEINPEVAAIIQLSKIGDVDWRSVLHSLTYVSQHFTKESLTEDLRTFYEMVSGLAVSGYDNLSSSIMQGSSFDGTFSQKATSVFNIVNNVYSIYDQADGSMTNVLKAYWGEAPTAADLFSFSSYNMTGWISDYLSGTGNTYYTQRYYIACVDRGSENVCEYYPPSDDESVRSGDHWIRFETTDPGFYPSSAQLESVLTNSESHAGWSRAVISSLNAQNNGYSYAMTRHLQGIAIRSGGQQTKKAYSYRIIVKKSWNIEEVVYEEMFDSYSMNLANFLQKMNGHVEEYNDNEEGRVYELLSDNRVYYQVATGAQVRGCESAIITLTCTDDVNLGEGSTRYKCGSCGSSLSDHTKECSMYTTLSSSDDEDTGLADLYGMKSSLEEEISDVQSMLADARERKAYLEGLVSSYPDKTDETYAELVGCLDAVNAEISELSARLTSLQGQLEEVDKGISEAQIDGEATDDYYRIPAIMQDLKTLYSLSWQGEGWWSGYTYYRYASSPSVGGTLTFMATLTIDRKPVHVFGVKIHRAIVKISWRFTASYTESQVIDNITFDAEMDDDAKARLVNDRLSEIAQEYPGCTTSVEYVKADNGDLAEDTDDTQHLLWASDRIAIAREVEARLMAIYAEIVSMRKMMHYKLSVLDALGGAVPYIDENMGRRQSTVEKCRMRWLRNAADSHHSLGYNGKYEIEDEEDSDQ